jgi:hypothetical protein
MGDQRERSPKERSERSERDVPARATAAPVAPVLLAPGIDVTGVGNRALLSLLRSGRLQRNARGSGQPASHGGDSVLGIDAGRRLEEPTRGFMERQFGEDFSHVRVHTGVGASVAAETLQARAFTVGSDIVFGERAFAPETSEGRHLLAHELTHVVQQGRGGGSPPPLSGGALEQDAEAAATAITVGHASVRVAGASAPGIARQPLPGDTLGLSLTPANVGMEPRSLGGSISVRPDFTNDAALALEMRLIREWLAAHPADPRNEHLTSELSNIQAEDQRRRGEARFKEARGLVFGGNVDGVSTMDTMDFLGKRGVIVELRRNSGSFYDPRTRTIVLSEAGSAEEMATALVFFSYQIAGSPDPKDRNEYIQQNVEHTAAAATLAIQFSQGLFKSTHRAPLEAEYTAASRAASDRTFIEQLRHGADPGTAAFHARLEGEIVARQSVSDAVRQGRLLTGDTHEPYADYFGKEFDWKQAERAREAEEQARRLAQDKIEDERRAKIMTAVEALGKIAGRVDPGSPAANAVIDLIETFVAVQDLPT